MSEDDGSTGFAFIEPCLVQARFVGNLRGPELTELFDQIDARVQQLPWFLIEAHMGEISSASPDARRLAAERLGRLPKFAIAVVGGSFAQRMIAKLVLTAHEMLRRSGMKSAFFKTDTEAQAWLWEHAKQVHGYVRPDAS